MEKVSIIVAAYNIEKYISKCLNSLINQTYSNLEIIVINDGSTDSTLEKIEKIAQKDSRIIIFSQENKGLIEARKSGFNLVTGKYVLFIDGDDWIDLNTIQILYNKAIEKNYDIVQYKYIKIFDDGNQIKDWDSNLGELKSEQLLSSLLLGNINHNIWTKFIRVDFIHENNILFPKEVSYGEDLALTFILYSFSPKIVCINEYLYYYFQRTTSLTNSVSEKMIEINQVIKFIKNILITNNQFEHYFDEYNILVYNQTFRLLKRLIFESKSNVGKKAFNKWKKHKICMHKNSYYKLEMKKYNFLIRFILFIQQNSFMFGKIIYNIGVKKG